MKKEDTVKLISAEGFEFVIDKNAAMVSQTIRNMLTSPGILSFFFSEKIRREVGKRKIIQFLKWNFVLFMFAVIKKAKASLTKP